MPGFRSLLAGQAVNAIGNWIAVVAIWGFAAFRFDATAGDLALLFVVLSLPGTLVGPVLGVVVDRLGPRRALIIANVVGCCNALALTQADSYRLVILLALPLGVIEALASTSLDAIPPRIVADDDLVAANALLGGSEDVAIIAGPILAAAVNVRWGLEGAFLADALTFLVGAAVAVRLDLDHQPTEEPESAWREVRAGLTLVRRTDGLRWTLAVAGLTYSLWALAGVLEPLYARDVLGTTDTTFALFQAAFGVGMVGMGLTIATLGDRVAQPRYVALATIASGATSVLYLGTTSLVVAFVGAFLWGIVVALFYVPAKTLLQRYAPMPAHGRILSLNQTLEPSAALVMTPLTALALGIVDVQQLAFIGGALTALGGVVALRRSRHLSPVPGPGPVDHAAGTPRDAVALGGPAPI